MNKKTLNVSLVKRNDQGEVTETLVSSNPRKESSFNLQEQYKQLAEAKDKTSEEWQLYYTLKQLQVEAQGSKTLISENFDNILFSECLFNGELYTVTGISGGGKTAFCCMLAACLISGQNNHLKKAKKMKSRPVIYVSLEQKAQQIYDRITSTLAALFDIENAIPFANLVAGQGYKADDLRFACELMSTYAPNLTVISKRDTDDSTAIADILKVLTTQVKDKDNPLIVIDQYVNIDNTNTPVNDDVVMQIKKFAEIHDVPIILQTQLSKEAINSATDKEGNINFEKLTARGLRGTSSLEHQSTAILSIVETAKTKVIQGKNATLVVLNLLKNRYGENKSLKFWYVKPLNLFFDYEESRGRPKKEANDETESNGE